MSALTDAQAVVLAVVRAAGERGITAREIAREVWPNDPAWHKVTAGRGASRHNGAQGATMPLRAGRVLARLEDARLVVRREAPWDNRWVTR